MKTAKTDKAFVISLADLAPRAAVTGGAGVRVFGQDDGSRPVQRLPGRRAGTQSTPPRKKT